MLVSTRWGRRIGVASKIPFYLLSSINSSFAKLWCKNEKIVSSTKRYFKPRSIRLPYGTMYGNHGLHMTVFFQTGHRNSWREQKTKLDRPWLRIVRERRIMKRFAAIEFKQKLIMPFCSPTHLASDWYLTLIAQIDLWLSNRLVNINHLDLTRWNFSSVFAPARNFYVWFEKKQSFINPNTLLWHNGGNTTVS